MECLQSHSLRVPKGGDKVYKDECVYCFNSPVSDCSLNCPAVIVNVRKRKTVRTDPFLKLTKPADCLGIFSPLKKLTIFIYKVVLKN